MRMICGLYTGDTTNVAMRGEKDESRRGRLVRQQKRVPPEKVSFKSGRLGLGYEKEVACLSPERTGVNVIISYRSR